MIDITEIYIIRHGETDSNLRSTCLGRKDAPLNAHGVEQAAELTKRFADIAIDAVYSSPLIRVRSTIDGVARTHGLEVKIAEELCERDYGDWDDLTFAEIEKRFPELYREWHRDWHGYTVPNGESDRDVRARVERICDRILTAERDKTVVIASHLGTSRHIIAYLLGMSIEASRAFWVNNCGAAHIHIGNKGLAVLQSLN